MFLRIYAALAFFLILAGDAFRYSVTWYGWGAVIAIVSAISVTLLIRGRGNWRFGGLPYPLVVFLGLTLLSTAWSFYPQWTAIGWFSTALTVTSAVAIAVTLTREEILRALGTALRLILGLSIVFELVVSLVVRHPILPFFSPYEYSEKLPKLLFWSRDVMLEGGKIQGIVGNSSLLAFVALLGLIVFGVQLAAGTVRRGWGLFWLAVAVATVLMTRSATITVALVLLAAVLLSALLLRRAKSSRGRLGVYAGMVGAVLVVIASISVFSKQILGVLGKSDDLTGRLDIWNAVIHLAQQRPVFGWGWVSYWVPFVPPFDTLASAAGIRQLHAHNAWLDLWLQVGIVGAVVFGALVITTLLRSWSLATDRPQFAVNRPGEYTAVSLLPLLVLVALIVQSFAESRILVEYGLLLLVVFAVSTKRQQLQPAPPVGTSAATPHAEPSRP